MAKRPPGAKGNFVTDTAGGRLDLVRELAALLRQLGEDLAENRRLALEAIETRGDLGELMVNADRIADAQASVLHAMMLATLLTPAPPVAPRRRRRGAGDRSAWPVRGVLSPAAVLPAVPGGP